MISPEQRAEIRRLFYAEHWRVGTIATTLGVHHDTVYHAIERDRFVRTGTQVRPSALDPYKAFLAATRERRGAAAPPVRKPQERPPGAGRRSHPLPSAPARAGRALSLRAPALRAVPRQREGQGRADDPVPAPLLLRPPPLCLPQRSQRPARHLDRRDRARPLRARARGAGGPRRVGGRTAPPLAAPGPCACV